MDGRLTNAQGKFLRALCYHRGTVEELAKECGSPMHTVERWLGERGFRRALRKRVRGMERLRELDVTRGSMEAARRLSRAAFGVGDFTKKNLYERRACVDLIQLARAREREAKAAAMAGGEGVGGAADAGGAAGAGVPSDRELVRRRHGEEAARAFDEMIRRNGAPSSAPPVTAPAVEVVAVQTLEGGGAG